MNKTKQASDIEFPTNPFLQFEWELNKLIKKYEKKEEASIRGYFVLVRCNLFSRISKKDHKCKN